MSGRDTDKGHRYIAALDDARCQERWSEVPELIRKVTKHAPERKCLIQTATAEHQVVTHLGKTPTAAGTSAPTSETSNLSELIPTLLSTVEEAAGSPQDVFQAEVCLAWVHWILSEPGLAVARLPKNFDETVQKLTEDGQALSPWTEVCLIKACYIKGAAQSLISQPDHIPASLRPGADNNRRRASTTLQIFSFALSRLSAPSQASLSCPQLSLWSERLLAKCALLACEEAYSRGSLADESTIEFALKSFRLWAAQPTVKQGTSSPASQVTGPDEPASQLSIWKSYYDFLSAILQHGIPYVPPSEGPRRVQLSSEFRHVESMYENTLLKEVSFPMANENNSQIESWVEQVIRNWEVFCGPDWRDEDLGEGGQDAVGRHVLDILYRAATKTYHSHLILRRLFHVHSALAEFDLAMKALDSYIEIVLSAKDRAEKSAESGELEDDEILLQTVSEGVIMLCCFGSRSEAEKAKSLTEILQKYVEKHLPEDFNPEEPGRVIDSQAFGGVSPRVIAMAFRAIGIGLANWARWTPVNEARDDIRAEAIENLENSIAPELGDQYNVSSFYALALLLAETRDIDGAIDYVKSVLAWNNNSLLSSKEVDEQAKLARERDLIPLWHLLGLLLSAKQEFDMAGRSCEAAFEQFPTAITSFGHGDKRSRRHQHDSEEFRKALIDQLRGREKERIVETRMTQLALAEVSEGPEAALNHSNQLLSLFATLFGDLDLQIESQTKSDTEHLVPPKSPSGTVRSFRSGIFGRKKGPRIPDHIGSEFSSTNTGTAPSSGTEAPAIQVTNENQGAPKERPQTAGRRNSIRNKLHKHESSLTKAARPGSRDPKAGGTQDVYSSIPASADATPIKTQEPGAEEQAFPEAGGIAVSEPTSPTSPKQHQSAKQPLSPIVHNMRHNREPAPAGHSKQAPEQDVRLPGPHRFESPTRAITKFPAVQAQKYALCILVKIWLFIAGLYRRASLFEDAREACEEASKQAARVEALVAAQESSARAFADHGWGAGKSSGELWADVYAERGYLSLARSLPHEAMEHFEEALMHFPDHPKATVGLANILLDIWDEKIPPEPPEPTLETDLSSLSLSEPSKPAETSRPVEAAAETLPNGTTETKKQKESRPTSSSKKETTKSLNRLAARDRAYGLLSTLTKLGSSWDNSEAWFALARVYEAGGQIEKAKEVLWWCVELEDRRPIRHWSNLGSGGYVL